MGKHSTKTNKRYRRQRDDMRRHMLAMERAGVTPEGVAALKNATVIAEHRADAAEKKLRKVWGWVRWLFGAR